MDYAIGFALALLVAGFAALVGFDRERTFYPLVLVVVALYYVLFAAMSGSLHVVLVESVFMIAFAALAVVGFKTKLWIVAAGLASHGVFDGLHGSLITNPGVPVWWPPFCLAYDVTAAGTLIWLLKHRPSLASEINVGR